MKKILPFLFASLSALAVAWADIQTIGIPTSAGRAVFTGQNSSGTVIAGSTSSAATQPVLQVKNSTNVTLAEFRNNGLLKFYTNSGIQWADGTTSTSAGGSGAGTGHFIGTGTLSAGSTYLASQPGLVFDGSFFSAVNVPSLSESFISVSTSFVFVSSTAINSTRQVFLTGSGTYTTPAGVLQLEIFEVGAGGGGGDNTAAGPGGFGGYSTFSSISAAGGAPGDYLTSASTSPTGQGWIAAGNPIRVPGGKGSGSTTNGSAAGGNSCLGGGGAGGARGGGAGGAGSTNSGGGGGGAMSSGTDSGGAASAGECVWFILNNPAASYSYAVGAPGAGGNSGGNTGGTGARGMIIVKENYSQTGPAGATGAQGPAGAGSETNTFGFGGSTKTFLSTIGMTSATASGQLIISGTETVAGNAFSVGGSTLVVSNGFLGLGVSNPANTLDVTSPLSNISSRIRGLEGGGFYLGSFDTAWGGFWSSSLTPSLVNYALIASAGGTAFNTPASGFIQFNVGDVTKMNLDSSGRVSIGASMTTASLLGVQGGAAFGTYGPATAAPANTIIVSGGLGVGTANPLTTLDIGGDSTIRGAETITSTLSVKGAAFSVGSSSFSVNGGSATIAYRLTSASLILNTVSTYSIVSSSGIQINGGGLLDLSQASGLRWPNGQISTAPAGGSSGGGGGSGNTIVISSAMNTIITQSDSNTTASYSLNGSSLDIVTSNTGYCDFHVNLVVGNSIIGGQAFVGFSVDGIRRPITATDNPPIHTNILQTPAAPAGGSQNEFPIHLGIGGLSANAHHTFSVYVYTNTGSWTITNDGQTSMNEESATCY